MSEEVVFGEKTVEFPLELGQHTRLELGCVTIDLSRPFGLSFPRERCLLAFDFRLRSVPLSSDGVCARGLRSEEMLRLRLDLGSWSCRAPYLWLIVVTTCSLR